MHTSKVHAKPNRAKDLPPPGPRKRNPKELDKMLDQALEDSMIASDPLSTIMPEVKEKSKK